MEWYHILLIILGAVLVLFVLPLFISSYFAFNYIFKRNNGEGKFEDMDLSVTPYKPYEEDIKNAIAFFKTLNQEVVNVKSHDGLRLQGYYYNNNSDVTVMFVHGYRASPFNNFSTVGKKMYEEGYNVFFIDQRAHNASEGKYTTFGIKERYDVRTWLYKLNDLYNPKKVILYGLSMGCASSEMALSLELPKNLKLAVLDCGFNDVFDLMMYQTQKRIKLNPYLSVKIMNIYAKLFAGFNMFETKSSDSLKEAKVPCFFIHGKKDDVVPFSHGLENYEACPTKKDCVFLEDVDHARCYYAGGKDLEEKLMKFIKEVLEEGEE